MGESICGICGGGEFAPGPGGRMSVTGVLPYCLKCGALERHRAIRNVFETLRDETFATASVLQFSRDPTVVPEWFKHYEVSTYNGENSLDLMRIDRDSGSYDLVVCNHVLEHVQYDNAALTELGRIVKDDGFVFLSFPDPARMERTAEYAEPRADQHYHWRVYGRDVEDRFRRYVPYLWIVAHETADPVTEAAELVYLLCRSEAAADRVRAPLDNARFVVRPPELLVSAS